VVLVCLLVNGVVNLVSLGLLPLCLTGTWCRCPGSWGHDIGWVDLDSAVRISLDKFLRFLVDLRFAWHRAMGLLISWEMQVANLQKAKASEIEPNEDKFK
jgi:hypothetical protein